MLFWKEFKELFENLHIKLGCVSSPDHGGDFFIGAGEGEDRGQGSRFLSSLRPLTHLEMEVADGHSWGSWRRILGKGLETGRQGLLSHDSVTACL